MHQIDWIVLFLTIAGIVSYGILKTRGKKDLKTYLLGSKELKWWTIGLSIMATQASAVTFLSTTGQGFDDGMRFAQFYIGLPIAMVILSVFFLPIYYRLNVSTAYEYLENRFDLRTRTFTAILFLIQRGMAAGLTIAAPAIVLSTILGWAWWSTNILLGVLVLIYTVFGGGKAVSVTQQQQMVVILIGMVTALVMMVSKLPANVHFGDALALSGKLGKLNVINFKFDWRDKYTFWSGMLGGVFLFLSYFGTDQSQVQRYLRGKSLRESKLGLLFNGIIKLPMQFLVLLVGVMMFVFYQYHKAPIHFNEKNIVTLQNSSLHDQFEKVQLRYDLNFEEKKASADILVAALKTNDNVHIESARQRILDLRQEERTLRDSVKTLIKTAAPDADVRDRDYAFLTFVMNNLPRGLVGFLLAVIFSAAMSSSSSELNALATTTMIDIYRRQIRPDDTDEHYTYLAKWFTVIWGVIVLIFATFATFFSNLIEAVNIVGSLFYGTILGVFLVGFFLKKINARSVFTGALCGESVVLIVYALYGWHDSGFPFLWLNPLGCLVTMAMAFMIQLFQKERI